MVMSTPITITTTNVTTTLYVDGGKGALIVLYIIFSIYYALSGSQRLTPQLTSIPAGLSQQYARPLNRFTVVIVRVKPTLYLRRLAHLK